MGESPTGFVVPAGVPSGLPTPRPDAAEAAGFARGLLRSARRPANPSPMRATPIFAALSAVVLAGCQDRSPPPAREVPGSLSTAAGTATHTVYDRAKFRGLVLGRTPDQVRAAVGKPDRMVESGTAVFWYYEGRTVNPTTGKPDKKVQVVFQYGQVTEIDY